MIFNENGTKLLMIAKLSLKHKLFKQYEKSIGKTIHIFEKKKN